MLKNIDCEYSLKPPRQGNSNEYPQSVFWAEIWKISVFILKFSVFGDKIFYIFEKACFRNENISRPKALYPIQKDYDICIVYFPPNPQTQNIIYIQIV